MPSTSLDIDVVKRGRRHHMDHDRDPQVEVKRFDTKQFLADTVGAGHLRYLSNTTASLPTAALNGRRYLEEASKAYPIPTTGLLVQTAHACFATHQGFGLVPDAVWQIIVNQVAEHVKLNAKRYERLFTIFSGEQINIEVRDDALLADNNWLRTLDMFEGPLRLAIGDDLVSLLVPEFSTTTQLDRVAALVSVMDAASPYYKYSVNTMCHIPLIRLEGTAQDWWQLRFRAELLSQKFDGLAPYFAALLPVLQEIAETAEGKRPDHEFWSSFYKFQSSSGSENVTGWITALMAFKYTPDGPVARDDFDWKHQIDRPYTSFKTNEIPSLLSTVPFTWKVGDQRLPMTFVAGVLGVRTSGRVFTPELGVAVMQH